MKAGIIGAMDVEISLLKSRMTDIRTSKIAHLTYYEGKLNGADIVLVKSGIGKVNAALCAQSLILKFGVSNIINTGIAGAMDKELRVLDTVVSTVCLYHDADTTYFGDPACTIPDMPTYFPADTKMIEIAVENAKKESAYKVHSGRIASGDQFICTKEGKKKIEELCHPMCVEMEGAAIAHACYLYKVPFVIIRSISDLADENVTLDYEFNRETAAQTSANLVCAIINDLK
ncbi:MAG: 5'-methylthioadenosine/adenosylhomocysteine nucleosidase [Treponemataceae bacterium]|nr:5'-methylthioadenosine/adenosylhomocysteine nucleosidase [Treponemataceae bacterium]